MSTFQFIETPLLNTMDDKDELEQITEIFDKILTPLGFEFYPFKIKWYNEKVSEYFQLSFHDDTLAFIILSLPHMFEKALIPFISNHHNTTNGYQNDPVDQCMAYYFQHVKQAFSNHKIEIYHDFDLLPSRRPKVLVQTAGHVAGATYFYQRSDLVHDPWDENKKIFGVSIHPKFGGWFGFRGVVIFSDVTYPALRQRQPPDPLNDDQKRIELLEKFNFHWQDWSYRDVIEVQERYSDLQKEFFSTKPADRLKILQKIKEQTENDFSSTLQNVSTISE